MLFGQDIGNQIKQQLVVHPFKDSLRVTYEFGIPTTYNTVGHLGIDVGETDKVNGDKLYAPFDCYALQVNNWLGSNIGWETVIQSKPITINGKRAVIRYGVIHTRGKSDLKVGDEVDAGEVIDISGGIFNWNDYWKGQHTHIWLMPRYDNGSPDVNYWQPDWNNTKNGFIDPLTISGDSFMKAIKSANSPHVYLLSNDGTSKMMVIDMSTLQALGVQFIEMLDNEVAAIPTKGTLVWTERLIQ